MLSVYTLYLIIFFGGTWLILFAAAIWLPSSAATTAQLMLTAVSSLPVAAGISIPSYILVMMVWEGRQSPEGAQSGKKKKPVTWADLAGILAAPLLPAVACILPPWLTFGNSWLPSVGAFILIFALLFWLYLGRIFYQSRQVKRPAANKMWHPGKTAADTSNQNDG